MADSTSAPPPSNTRWFSDDPPPLRDDTREVLEKYSKIPPDEVLPHCYAIVSSRGRTRAVSITMLMLSQRDKAWAIHNYPCIGQWRFLDLSIGRHQLYPEVLSRMRTGNQIYLDLGCAFAQDVRRLVADGVDSSKCYGSDLRLDFIEIGYEMFRDKDTLKTKFIAADIFDADSSLKELGGTVDIIGASSFFHLFNWDEQKTIALRVAKLLKPEKGSLVLGRQVGNEKAGEYPRRQGEGNRYRHNNESWRKLWNEIGDEIGVQFEVDGMSRPISLPFHDTGDSLLEYSVRRL